MNCKIDHNACTPKWIQYLTFVLSFLNQFVQIMERRVVFILFGISKTKRRTDQSMISNLLSIFTSQQARLSMASQLAFWNWANPRYSDVEADGDGADDPEHLWIVETIVAEDDGKDDTAEVTWAQLVWLHGIHGRRGGTYHKRQ